MNKNRQLIIKRYEHNKITAAGNIMRNEIRIMELEAEIERCKEDTEAQKGVMAEQDKQIEQQREEIKKGV